MLPHYSCPFSLRVNGQRPRSSPCKRFNCYERLHLQASSSQHTHLLNAASAFLNFAIQTIPAHSVGVLRLRTPDMTDLKSTPYPWQRKEHQQQN